jgi:NAD(P)-dependent dehydrogenase (short-subunit alcohol dehydrogenase family)
MPEQLLNTFEPSFDVAVIGANGGIGEALVEILLQQPSVNHVFRCSRSRPKTSLDQSSWIELDISNEETIVAAAENIKSKSAQLSLIIVATGILHVEDHIQPEKSWTSLDTINLSKVFQINTIGPALVAKHFFSLLPKAQKAVFVALSARVGSISDNKVGGWHSYRCAKAALNMLIKTLSVELSRKNPYAIAITLHPGTVNTKLSKPFQSRVPVQQLLTPEYSAAKLLEVINSLTVIDTGDFFAWDGAKISF